MATEKQLNTRIQLKYDSLANWNANGHVVLKKGEIGICAIPSGSSAVNGDSTRPQILFKVGDDSSTFANLPWASAKAADVYDWAKQANLPVTKVGTGNVVSGIEWDETNKGIKFTTASVATSESLETVQTNLSNLTDKVNGMYTNAQIDAAVAAAKKAGDDAASALASYKTDNDAAVQKNADDIAAINNATSGILAQAKKYADDKDAAMDERVDALEAIDHTLYAVKTEVASTYATQAAFNSYKTDNDAAVQKNASDIAAINNETSGILAQAKTYADGKDSAMNTRVEALEAIKHDEFAKSADVVSNSTFEEFKTNNTAAIGAAEKAAKDYTDQVKAGLLGEGITETYDTLVEIQTWIEGAGVNATELTQAIAVETKAREDADKALGERIDGVVVDYAAADAALGIRIDNVVNGTTPVAKAAEATKAAQDGDGNVITATYATKTELSTAISNLEQYADQAEADAKKHADDAVAGLKTDLESADSALDGRIAGLEAAFTGSVANEAAKVSNALTVNMEDGSSVVFDGSAVKSVDLTNLATKAYADQAEADALSAAKSYADGAVASEALLRESADSALDGRIKTVEDSYLNNVTVGSGLKVSNSPDIHGRLVEIDDSVTFVFNCGTASTLVD